MVPSHHHGHGGWDIHTHIIPPGVIAAAEKGRYGMQAGAGTLKICGLGVPIGSIAEIDKLAERIHSDELDGAIVSVPPPLFRPDLSRTERRDYADLVNDSLLSACRSGSGAFRTFANLPAEEPELAAEIAGTLGRDWSGVVMGTELGALSYASSRFDPLWQTLSEAGLPLFIHPGATKDERLTPFYLSNLAGNPIETTIAAAHLVFGGVLHRFPRLKVILAHGGGCVAALCGRWQRGSVTRRPGIPKLATAPIDAVRRFYVDSLVHSPPFLRAVIELIGEDRVLLGSDWPFPMGAPSADHDLSGLDPALRYRIRKTNAEEAFGPRLLS